jgi:hypothetical protein
LNSATVTDLLYKKLMASEVDVTPCNLRITPRENGDELARRVSQRGKAKASEFIIPDMGVPLLGVCAASAQE